MKRALMSCFLFVLLSKGVIVIGGKLIGSKPAPTGAVVFWAIAKFWRRRLLRSGVCSSTVCKDRARVSLWVSVWSKGRRNTQRNSKVALVLFGETFPAVNNVRRKTVLLFGKFERLHLLPTKRVVIQGMLCLSALFSRNTRHHRITLCTLVLFFFF